eukprot:CAMPEP_0197935604 /NCGR_PEP_ID=MMETSP1439-20131203/113584_1 /TAXON_ID=66791 /ORGANISM="Gonyaulax spinifera, Strain CCMP409" /LENGTH=60 /DNA_ID=CAMNT_0043558551 /DNA_START=23 /DNA_END=205 /DNA_ORIENTATION=+
MPSPLPAVPKLALQAVASTTTGAEDVPCLDGTPAGQQHKLRADLRRGHAPRGSKSGSLNR